MYPSSPPQFTNDNPSIVLQDRTRQLSKTLRLCLENHTGFHHELERYWMTKVNTDHSTLVEIPFFIRR